MTRKTSIDIYHDIKESGFLGDMQERVFDILHKANEPMTASEVVQELEKQVKLGKHGMGSRLPELRDMGAVCEMPPRACNVTGRVVLTWTPTYNMPYKAPRKKSRKELDEEKDQLVAHLQQENRGLKARLAFYEALNK